MPRIPPPVRWPTRQVKIDLTEHDDHYAVKAEIPGVRKEDIDVRIDGNHVTISAEVKKGFVFQCHYLLPAFTAQENSELRASGELSVRATAHGRDRAPTCGLNASEQPEPGPRGAPARYRSRR
jgi:hypothetical protein